MTTSRSPGIALAFAAGLATVAWIAAGFGGAHPLALSISLLIGIAYIGGAIEIARFRAATRGLLAALQDTSKATDSLEEWLMQVSASLRPAVRLRIEGERVALPGLALTPYLVGLLVMLGMLGTFMGMVATFRGTVTALEGSTDLEVLRGALAEPVRGLALAFGTSVAGVASSAMLGLMSVLARGERAAAARQLDDCIPTVFRTWSLPHQRQATWEALRAQGSSLPEVGARLGALIEAIEGRQLALETALLQRQEQLLKEVASGCERLLEQSTAAMDRNLEATLRATREAMQQSATAAATAIGDGAEAAGAALQTAVAASGESVRATVGGAMESLAAEALATRADLSRTLEVQFGTLLERVGDGIERATGALATAEAQRLAGSIKAVEDVAAALREEIARIGNLASDQHTGTAQLLESTATAIAASVSAGAVQAQQQISALLAQSEELVRARVESESRWQQQLAERDTAALQERAQLTGNIEALLQSVARATGAQHEAIETLVTSASGVLEQVGSQFAETLAAQTLRAEEAATRVSGSATDLASLGEAFHHGVDVFSASHEKLIASLNAIESALGQHMARSDEQLAYYVEQAREIIDLSISSQQGILEDLRRLRVTPSAATSRDEAEPA